MKTPMQELLEWARKFKPTPSMIEAKIVLMLEKEKEVIVDAWNSAYGGDSFHDGEQYYNETFNTKEK